MDVLLLLAPFAALLSVTLLFVVVAQSGRSARDRARLAVIERRLDLLLNRLEITAEPIEYPDVLDHVRNGRRIQAIKAYRRHTGVDLAEAKAAIDRLC